MQLETHEAQRMDCPSAVVLIVVKGVTQMGRLRNYFAKQKQGCSAPASGRRVAKESGVALGFYCNQNAAVWRNGPEGDVLLGDHFRCLAPEEFITRFSSRSQQCGLDGPVCGTTSKAGGTSVVQKQLNQNTEQHRCNAV